MPTIDSKEVTLWKAAARESDRLYLAVTVDALVSQEVSHSVFLSIYRGEWRDCGQVSWSTIAVCFVRSPSLRFLAVSEDGEVYTYVSGESTAESIDPAPAALAAVSEIDGQAYACGMLRQVYVRTAEGKWKDLSAPAPKPGVTAGFEAISGYGKDDIYAVGWEGEIWQRKRGKWIERESPVNIILTGVTCCDDGYVYVCGQNGTLIKGRDDEWQVVDQDDTEDDFWDIHAFQGVVYACSFNGLFQIKKDVLSAVKFGKDAPGTFHRLTSADGVLWSVGAQDVFAFDGKKWKRAP